MSTNEVELMALGHTPVALLLPERERSFCGVICVFRNFAHNQADD
jgi:hypothetical protein